MHHRAVLPYSSFTYTAQVLDRVTLGVQRIFCTQALATLSQLSDGVRSAWSDLPGVLEWRGRESALGVLLTILCREWELRGYTCGVVSPYDAAWARRPGWPDLDHAVAPDARSAVAPDWLADPVRIGACRAALLARAPEHYAPLGWTVAPSADEQLSFLGD